VTVLRDLLGRCRERDLLATGAGLEHVDAILAWAGDDVGAVVELTLVIFRIKLEDEWDGPERRGDDGGREEARARLRCLNHRERRSSPTLRRVVATSCSVLEAALDTLSTPMNHLEPIRARRLPLCSGLLFASRLLMTKPILVTGAAGRVGGVGRMVGELLLRRGLPVRAFVHQDDERADELRSMKAEVVVGDLTHADDVARALDGCRRMYFGMSVSAKYLEATVIVAAVAREHGLEALVNISQMTVSQMSLGWMSDSTQQRQHWMAEQVLSWSGLPVVEVRPTAFLENPLFKEWAAESIAEDGTLRLPFGAGRTSPIAARDVAEVIATVLAEPSAHLGKVYELTGPHVQDMCGVAQEYSTALGRTIRYVDVPFDEWEGELRSKGLPDHLLNHLVTMARLHAANRYDRLTNDVEAVIGRPATSITEYVAENAAVFTPAPPSKRASIGARRASTSSGV
jgi:NAD(P)H dehydrogenase (quinone)